MQWKTMAFTITTSTLEIKEFLKKWNGYGSFKWHEK